MISQTAEYCLRAVLCLAAHPAGGMCLAGPRGGEACPAAGGICMTTQAVAEATRIPPGYLSKVMQLLSRAGIVKAQRGLNGGFVLAREPATLTLLEVVRVADPCRRIATCPLGIHGTNLCALHRQLDRAAALAEEALEHMTVADLMEASAGTHGECEGVTGHACAHGGAAAACLK